MLLLYALATTLSLHGCASATSKISQCKTTPESPSWPNEAEWAALNDTIDGNLIRGVPPASVCYKDEPNYNPERCAAVAKQWFNSTWHAEDPISIDYPIWTNNSCNPIWPNGTSLTGDVNAGKKGCTIGHHPVYVVDAKTPEHISEGHKWAAKKNIRVVIKNTGHSYQGRSTGLGSLSIRTYHFQDVEYIPDYRPKSCPVNGTLEAVRIGAGVTGIDALAALKAHDRVIVTGANPDVGLIGWMTGGGHGYLSSDFGMGADNLLEATIVAPNGDILTINPCQHSDLFFATRGGGGGTFGVITSAVIRAFPSPTVASHLLAISYTGNNSREYWDMIAYIHAEMPRLKEGGVSGFYFSGYDAVLLGTASAASPRPAYLHFFSVFNKPNGTIEKLHGPIESYLAKRRHLFTYVSNYTSIPDYHLFAATLKNEDVATGGSAYGSRLMSAESLSDEDRTADFFSRVGPSGDPHRRTGVVADSILLGHFDAPNSPPSYYPSHMSLNPAWRKTVTHIITTQRWQDGSPQSVIEAVYKDVTNNRTQALRELSPETGAYFNEADSFEPDWQRSFWGENYKKLFEVKKTWDPEGLLWCRRCVGSEMWVEQKDGRLCRAESGAGYGYQI